MALEKGMLCSCVSVNDTHEYESLVFLHVVWLELRRSFDQPPREGRVGPDQIKGFAQCIQMLFQTIRHILNRPVVHNTTPGWFIAGQLQ